MDSHYIKVLPFIFDGLGLTVMITLVGLLFGFLLGTFAGLGRLSKKRTVFGISTVYIEVIRGTPMLAQIMFIYFGISDLTGINIDKVSAAIIAIAINAGAYIAEIVRGAVESVDDGQMEAGRSLGLTHNQTMRYIIWPQAFRRMIPALGNQFVISFKDTSLLSVIAVHEMLYQARQYYTLTFSAFEATAMLCVVYLMITIPAMLLLRKLERRLDV